MPKLKQTYIKTQINAAVDKFNIFVECIDYRMSLRKVVSWALFLLRGSCTFVGTRGNLLPFIYRFSVVIIKKDYN